MRCAESTGGAARPHLQVLPGLAVQGCYSVEGSTEQRIRLTEGGVRLRHGV